MQRISTSLSNAGYDVLLVGRKQRRSVDLVQQPFRQKRLNCFFEQGPAFYFEYNLRLFFFLLFTRMDLVCAIDLDTILPCYFASVIRRKQRVYDAHELFTEMKEIVSRPRIRRVWMGFEKFAVPKFQNGYTVNQFLADEFERRYKVRYGVVRNLPVLYDLPTNKSASPPFIIYQGAVNEGRGFEQIIPAMREVNAKLVICGEGNFFEQTKQLINQYGVAEKVELQGYVSPRELRQLTPTAYVALMIFEPTGSNQFYSLSNRFFDYIMAGVPQVCVNYPEYKNINDRYGVALMIDNIEPSTIAANINQLLKDDVLHAQLKMNCQKARAELNWSAEAETLISLYHRLLPVRNAQVSDTTADAMKTES